VLLCFDRQYDKLTRLTCADLASKEVILSAGALDSPKILMHSGIGPKDQLAKYNIPIIQDSPVGQNLRDHYFTSLVYSRTDVSTDRKAFYGNQGAMDAALRQWEKDRSGDWTKFACDAGIGFLKSEEILASEEFKSLPMSEQRYLQLPTVPHYEVITHFPVHWFIPDYPAEHLSYSCLAAFIYNSQACGEATLQSSDPSVPLKFDPKFLSHPYDRRVAIESLRSLIKIADHPAYAKDTVAHIAVPKSSSDKDLLEYWENSLNSSWHMMGTAKMGNGKGSDAVVDSHFRVLGLSNLRVADMSVLPVLLNGHTQAAAYVTGATCAEMLISEYGLENTLSWFS
jgi:choline dehydrogenase-like flavoprotein